MIRALLRCFVPDLIVSSDYLRACSTAEIALSVAKEKGKRNVKLIQSKLLRPPMGYSEWTRFVNDNKEVISKSKCVMIVGHEPSLSRILAGHLYLARPVWTFRKSGAAVISRLNNKTFTLHSFLSPKTVRRLQ